MLIDFYNKSANYLIDSLDANFIFLSFAITMILSVVYFIILCWIIARLDKTYFLREYIEQVDRVDEKSLIFPQKQWLRLIAFVKIFLGVVLLLMGIAMLVLPGQGLITILVGLSLIPFPGKRRLELFLLSRKAVRSSLNWIRLKENKDPFVFDTKDEKAD